MLKHLQKNPARQAPAKPLRQTEPDFLLVGELEARLVRSTRRRTVTIKVEAGAVRVMAPTFVARAEVENFLGEKYHWVLQKVREQAEQLAAAQRVWRSGARLPFCGREICLSLTAGARAMTYLQDDCLHVALPASEIDKEEQVKRRVAKWYRRQADKTLAARLEHWQQVTAITAASCKVRAYKARWGSCSHRGDVSFNWKLIMAPMDVLDYVIIHELCHIVHFNHSPAYWALVGRFAPNYAESKIWLKDNCLTLADL